MENKCSSGSKCGLVISIVALIVAAISYFYPSKPADISGSSTLDEKVKSIVVDLIKQNPQLLMDAMGEGIAKKREDTIKQLTDDVLAQKDDLTKHSMKFGKADAASSVICFFDPLCKHCIDFQKTMLKLIKAKKEVSFNLLPVAVLGNDSAVLAKTYLAIYEKSPEKALAFIEKITADGSNMDKSAIEKALKTIDLDSKEVEAMLEAADKKLSENGVLVEKLKIPFVPAIFVLKGQNVNIVQATGIDDILPYIEQHKNEAGEAKAAEEQQEKPAKESK